MNTISRETFEGMDEGSKLNVMFDLHMDTNSRLQILERKVDKRRKFDTAFAGITGFVGGFIAVIGGKIFK